MRGQGPPPAAEFAAVGVDQGRQPGEAAGGQRDAGNIGQQRGSQDGLSFCSTAVLPSAWSLAGRRRRGPWRDRIAGTALTRGCRAWLSWVLAAETATARGRPARSDRTWIFELGLPRSTGFAPVSGPPIFARTLALSQIARDQSTCPPAPSSSRAARACLTS